MRPALVRLALAAAAVSLAVTGVHADAAATGPSKLVVKDASGDALGQLGQYDITQVTFSTSGSKASGRYVPKAIVVTLTSLKPFSTTAGATYEVDAELSGCGYTNFTYTPGSALSEGGLFTECGSPEDETGSTSTLYATAPVVKGNTVTWEFAFSGLSPEFKKGAVFTDITAHTVQNEPVFGIIGSGIVGPAGNLDNAATDRSYKIA